MKREEAKKGRKSAASGGSKLLRKERKDSEATFTVVQLLSVLEAGLRLDTESIRFDYVSLHVRCFKLLKAVKAASHDYISGKVGPRYIEHEFQMPFIVGWILQIAMMSNLAGIQLGLRQAFVNAGMHTGSKLLFGASYAMKQFLADPREAEAEIRKLRVGAVA